MATNPLPDFSNTTLFPTFITIPQDDEDGEHQQQQQHEDGSGYYLLAQVKDNMTINKPTLVLTDRDTNPFALVFEGLGRDDLDLKGLGFKKGYTAVVPRARRTRPADETKRGFVRVARQDAARVKAVPAPLARVLEVAGSAPKGTRCETCGKEEGGDGARLKSCTGCERVGYCSKVSSSLFFSFSFFKGAGFLVGLFQDGHDEGIRLTDLANIYACLQECQVKGWTEGGHKNDCKMFKALNTAFSS